LVRRLAAASPADRAAFATAVAERLFGLYARYAERTGTTTDDLRAALDEAWDAAAGEPSPEDLARWQDIAEGLVPDEEDDGWVDESAYGQNGAAAVAYALRTHLGGDPQEAAWAARQLYDAADYAAQRQVEDLDLNDPRAEDTLLATPVVQEALAGIEQDLAGAVEDGAALRARAQEGGVRLAALVFGDKAT
jgi:hypothetical protein